MLKRNIKDARKKIESQENDEKQLTEIMDNDSEISLTWTDSESDGEAQDKHFIDNQQEMDDNMDVDDTSKSPSLSVYTQSVHKSAIKKRRKIDQEIHDIMYVQFISYL